MMGLEIAAPHVHVGAPEFLIHGNPDGILERVSVMRRRASDYTMIADSLTSITTDGWTGRAAERFRERFEVEPRRWTEASDGFTKAASALEMYANDLARAQSDSAQCRADYEEGNRVTKEAHVKYLADVAEKQKMVNHVGYFNLTIPPFQDPGQALREKAERDFKNLLSGLNESAQTAADLVRAACENAPKKRNWIESGLAFIGGVISHFGKGLVENLKSLLGPLNSLCKLATGELTPEEFAAKWEMSLERVQQAWKALQDDPLGFGKDVAKNLLEWDMWADDPAKATGRLLSNVVDVVGTRGAGKLNKLDDIGDVSRGAGRALDAQSAAGMSRGAHGHSNASPSVDSGDDIAGRAGGMWGARGSNVSDSSDSARGSESGLGSSRLGTGSGGGVGSGGSGLRRGGDAGNADDAGRRSNAGFDPDGSTARDYSAGKSGGDGSGVRRSVDEVGDSVGPSDRVGSSGLPAEALSSRRSDLETRMGPPPSASHADDVADTTSGASQGTGGVTMHADDAGKVDEAAEVRRELSDQELAELRSRPPESIDDVLNAVPEGERYSNPYDEVGRVADTRGADLIEDPKSFFGKNSDGAPRTYDDWVKDYTDPDSGDVRWPEEKPGSIRNGMIDDGTIQKGMSLEEFRAQYGDTIDRVGGPGGRYFGAIEDGRVPTFEERSIAPSSVHQSYYQYKIADGPLPDGVTIETGTVAPWNGGSGGARQLQFFENGVPLSAEELLDKGILKGADHVIGLS